jgi:hypothetical protein
MDRGRVYQIVRLPEQPSNWVGFGRRFSDVFFVHRAETSFGQLQASVLVVNEKPGNQAPVTIDRMRQKSDIFAEYKLTTWPLWLVD